VFPYIMAMQGDGHTAYDKDNDGKANEVAGCSVRPARRLGFLPIANTHRPAESAMPKSQPKLASPTSKTNTSVSSFSTRPKTNGRNASRSPTSRSHRSHT
jgi:hypothetical protein